eukprot:GILK01006708.1.p1 GENE.GILK01006708.1~~GILK01006708.1.p1  ORF type:complete len:379 (+),score=62.41 GILK01006708.1:61-1197(+)
MVFTSRVCCQPTVSVVEGGESHAWDCHVLVPHCINGKFDDDFETFELLEDGSKLYTEWTEKAKAVLEQSLRPLVSRITWHPVFLENYQSVIDSLDNTDPRVIVLNLIDGSELDGWPGVSALKGLEARGLAFTGANATFYSMDTDKTAMKKLLAQTEGVTPPFLDLTREPTEEDIGCISKMDVPLIVKPSPSSSSRGISEKSVVWTPTEALEQAKQIRSIFGGAFLEEFISGREFTALVAGDALNGYQTYAAVERVFRRDLPEHQQLLTYKRKWEEWGVSAEDDKEWFSAVAPIEVQESVQHAALKAYKAAGGNGYARLDLRMDAKGRIFTIDVNANCALDFDELSAMGIALRGSNLTLTEFLSTIFSHAASKHQHVVS